MIQDDEGRDENRPDEETPSRSNSGGEREKGGLGEEATIPAHPEGVAAGYTGTPSTFEPEEDEAAD